MKTRIALALLAVGVVVAGVAAYVQAAATAPLFAQSQEVPSTADSGPSSQDAAAVERARQLVRAAITEQNLPGVSVAVGTKEKGVVWAEGFGWRDVGTKAAVTPRTRFHIGTAASAVAAAVAPLGLTSTGADEAKEWSPEAIGEPAEDFPLFTLLRHTVFQPLGFAPAEYPLKGDRATFYVPRSGADPGTGHKLMYMRDLACCARGKAFYSTPSDLVRFALAGNRGSVNGELAGGLVMSVTTHNGTAVAVMSNMAHAKTSGLALRIGEAFAQ